MTDEGGMTNRFFSSFRLPSVILALGPNAVGTTSLETKSCLGDFLSALYSELWRMLVWSTW